MKDRYGTEDKVNHDDGIRTQRIASKEIVYGNASMKQCVHVQPAHEQNTEIKSCLCKTLIQIND